MRRCWDMKGRWAGFCWRRISGAGFSPGGWFRRKRDLASLRLKPALITEPQTVLAQKTGGRPKLPAPIANQIAADHCLALPFHPAA